MNSPPIPMLLKCPDCGERHIDRAQWRHRPHKVHACQACGWHWQPALVPTVGVEFLPGCQDEAAVREREPAPLIVVPGERGPTGEPTWKTTAGPPPPDRGGNPSMVQPSDGASPGDVLMALQARVRVLEAERCAVNTYLRNATPEAQRPPELASPLENARAAIIHHTRERVPREHVEAAASTLRTALRDTSDSWTISGLAEDAARLIRDLEDAAAAARVERQTSANANTVEEGRREELERLLKQHATVHTTLWASLNSGAKHPPLHLPDFHTVLERANRELRRRFETAVGVEEREPAITAMRDALRHLAGEMPEGLVPMANAIKRVSHVARAQIDAYKGVCRKLGCTGPREPGDVVEMFKVLESVIADGHAYAQVCEALGIEYVAEGHDTRPGPIVTVLKTIKELQANRNETLDNLNNLNALDAALRASCSILGVEAPARLADLAGAVSRALVAVRGRLAVMVDHPAAESTTTLHSLIDYLGECGVKTPGLCMNVLNALGFNSPTNKPGAFETLAIASTSIDVMRRRASEALGQLEMESDATTEGMVVLLADRYSKARAALGA